MLRHNFNVMLIPRDMIVCQEVWSLVHCLITLIINQFVDIVTIFIRLVEHALKGRPRRRYTKSNLYVLKLFTVLLTLQTRICRNIDAYFSAMWPTEVL